MSIKQIIQCSVCGKEEIEKETGAGFTGWGALQGISLDGEDNPTLCPIHLKSQAKSLDIVKSNFNIHNQNEEH